MNVSHLQILFEDKGWIEYKYELVLDSRSVCETGSCRIPWRTLHCSRNALYHLKELINIIEDLPDFLK